jgi:uncharacterized membrane protein YjjP (DUF1212 family)
MTSTGRGSASSIEFLIRLATALHSYGTPAHRLEEALELIARDLDMHAQFLVTPTSIVFAHGEHSEQQTILIRTESGDEDLDRLSALHETIRDVHLRLIDTADATQRIADIISRPARYGHLLTMLSFAAASGGATVMFGGGAHEVGAASAIGLIIGALAQFSASRPRLARAFPMFAAFIAAFVARGFADLWPPLHSGLATLSGLIVLLPGLTLTVAMNELAHRHLVSGSARLVGAFVTFLQIGMGVALGDRIAGLLGMAGSGDVAVALPSWAVWAILPVSGVALTILFRARGKDIPIIILSGIVGFGATRLGTAYLGPELGVAGGAWLLGVLSNVFARWADRPTAIALVPGMLFLVPGSIGFRSLDALFRDDILGGLETGFAMVLIAVSLVSGLFLSNLTVSSRRLL